MEFDLKRTPVLTAAPPLHPVAGATFALLDDTPIVFSEADQKIFELNQLAAFIWCCLEDRISAETICINLVASGIDPATARGHVYAALRNWLKLGLIEPDWKLSESHAFKVSVGKLSIHVRASSELIVRLLIPLFVSPYDAGLAQETFDVIESDGLVNVLHGRNCIFRCSVDELAPMFKAYLTEQAIMKSAPDVAFHAACLLSQDKALLLSGPPGAGKTTLALHLLDAGFTYSADDVVLIAPDGTITGLPFAPTVKSGAWPIVVHLRPDLDSAAIHTRPDGKRVRYLKVSSNLHHGKKAVNWIFFIKRVRHQQTKLTQLGELETVRRLIDGSYSSNGKLTCQAFGAVKRILASAKSFELQYSDAIDARRSIMDLCNGNV